MRFTPEIAATLKSYVYLYIDPRDHKPFYVGKGIGNRAFSHLEDDTEGEKVNRIKAIRHTNLEPLIDIIRYGLTDEEAALVEASVIDEIGIPPLTNKCRGQHSRSFGRINSTDLNIMLSAKEAEIRHRAMLITINKLYRSDMSPDELYEATRGIWKVGKDRDSVELVLAVYRGIVREVYRVSCWEPAGSRTYNTRDSMGYKGSGRWEFVGEVAANVRDDYVNRSVRRYLTKGSQNPIKYVNVKASS